MMLFSILAVLVAYANAFNLDIGETAWKFEGSARSRFGHSITLHSGDNSRR